MMKTLLYSFLLLLCMNANAQQASMLLPGQSNNPKLVSPTNLLYVDQSTFRIWPVWIDSIKMKHVNMKWLLDTTNNHYPRMNVAYANPSWISSLSYSKITGAPSQNVYSGGMGINKSGAEPSASFSIDPNEVMMVQRATDSIASIKSTINTKANKSTTITINGVTHDLSGNSSYSVGTLTSEVDPNVPDYAKTLSGFNVIKASTDALYKPIGYVPTYAELTGKPTLFDGNYNSLTNKPTIPTNTNQLTNGAGFITGFTESDPIWLAQKSGYSTKAVADGLYYPLSANPNGYLTTVPAQSYSSLTGKPTFATVATTGDYNDLSNKPTIPSYTAGGGITISSGVISQTTPTYNNAPARAMNTSFRPSTTRPTRVSYTVSIATAISLLNLNSSGTVQLQISQDNTTFTTINSAGITRALAVSISVGLNDTSLLNIAGEIPAGYYCKLTSTVSGGATVAFSSGQEVTY